MRACWSRPARAKPKTGWWCSTDSRARAAQPQDGARVSGSSVDLSTAPEAQRYCARYGADPARYGRSAATVAAAGEDRQRSVRSRLFEVHSLLQVRRSVRNRRAEHLRDRRRRARVRRAHLDRIRRAAARFGVRVLRQLHRRLSDRRADVFAEHEMRAAGTWDEARQTQTDTICPYCGVGCTLRAPRPGRTRSSRSRRRSRTASRTATSASRAGSERPTCRPRGTRRVSADERRVVPGGPSRPRYRARRDGPDAKARRRRHRRAARDAAASPDGDADAGGHDAHAGKRLRAGRRLSLRRGHRARARRVRGDQLLLSTPLSTRDQRYNVVNVELSRRDRRICSGSNGTSRPAAPAVSAAARSSTPCTTSASNRSTTTCGFRPTCSTRCPSGCAKRNGSSPRPAACTPPRCSPKPANC